MPHSATHPQLRADLATTVLMAHGRYLVTVSSDGAEVLYSTHAPQAAWDALLADVLLGPLARALKTTGKPMPVPPAPPAEPEPNQT